MDATGREADAKVLTNPFDSPTVVETINRIAAEIHSLRERLGTESDAESTTAKRWGQAAGEVLDEVRVGTAGGAVAAERFGDQAFDRATEVFRVGDLDDNGVPDQPRAAAAAKSAGAAIKEAATGAAGTVGSVFRRKRGADEDVDEPGPHPSGASIRERVFPNGEATSPSSVVARCC